MVPSIRAFTRSFHPGKIPTNRKQTFSHFHIPQDLTGKEVPEIGTLDGRIAFEAAARGTIVTALERAVS
jgi:hypothetical protein